MRSFPGWTINALVLLVACSPVETDGSITTAAAESHPGSTPTTTMTAGELSTLVVDLLDGSRLEVVGPSELELTGYFFVMAVPEIRSTNVDLSRDVDPADAASVDQAAVLESNLGDGVRLWRADRGGQPFYLSVDLGGWAAFFHVGHETAPDSELLLSLAAQLQGVSSKGGVVLNEYEPAFFTTYLSDPHSENQVHLAANKCVRERVPDADVVEHPTHGVLIRGPGYASWCEEEADIEVTAYGDEQFVERVVSGVTLVRNQTSPGGA